MSDQLWIVALTNYTGGVNDRKKKHFTAVEGYSNSLTVDDMEAKKLRALGYTGSLSSMWHRYLTSLGGSGSLGDMLKSHVASSFYATAANAAPVAVPDSFSVAEDATYLGVLANNLLADDTDADGDTLTLTHINGVALTSGVDQGGGAYRHTITGSSYIDIDSDGDFGYTPNGQTISDNFSYTISDGNGGTAIGYVSVTITPVLDLADTNITIRTTDGAPILDEDFTAGITGYNAGVSSPTISHDSGQLKIDGVAGSSAYVELTTVDGTEYSVTATSARGAGVFSSFGIISSSTTDYNTGRIDLWASDAGPSHSGTFTAVGTTLYLHFSPKQTGELWMDDIRVAETVAIGDAESATTLAGSGTITSVTGATLVGDYWELDDFELYIHQTSGAIFYGVTPETMCPTRTISFVRNGQSGQLVVTNPDVAAPTYNIFSSYSIGIDEFVSGTSIGSLSSDMIGTQTFSIVDNDGLPIELSGTTVQTNGTLTAGSFDVVFRVLNDLGDSHDETITHTISPAATGIFRGQHSATLRPGPLGGEATFTTIDGTSLHPTGSGVYRYVDGSVVSSGDGLSLANAYKTVQEAQDAAAAGDTILIEAGYYPEQVTKVVGSNMANATDRIKISRRGTADVTIGGGDLVTGWTACVSGDADNNPNWANMYKATIADTWPVGLSGSVLQQAGTMAYIRMTGENYTDTASMFSRNDTTKFYEEGVGDATDLTESKSVDTHTLTSATIFGGYSAGQLDDALVMMLYSEGNNTTLAPIDTHNSGAGTITFDTSFTFNDKFGLVNVASDIDAAGQWAFEHDSGNSEYTLYFWPYDTGAMDDIRLTARENVFECKDADYYTYYGINFADAAGATDNRGYAFRSGSAAGSDTVTGVIMRECSGSRTCNSANVGKGMFFDGFLDLTYENNTVELIQDGAGLLFSGCTGAAQYNMVQNIGGNGWGNYAADGFIIAYNHIRSIRSAHGNGMSAYLGNDGLLIYGNIFDPENGICLTVQESSNIWVAMNVFIIPSGDTNHRGYENNNTSVPVRSRNTDDFITGGVIVAMNNTTVPWSTATIDDAGSGLSYGQTPGATHHVVNNVTFGEYVRPHDGTNFLTAASGTLSTVAPPSVTLNDTAVGSQSVFTWSGSSNALFSDHTITVSVGGSDIGSAYTLGEYDKTTALSTITLDVAATDGQAIVVTATGTTYYSIKGTLNNNYFVSDISDTDLAKLDGSTRVDAFSTVWQDATAGAFRPVSGGALDGTGVDYSSLLPSGSWVSGFDFTKDAYGRSFTWATDAPIGALVAP